MERSISNQEPERWIATLRRRFVEVARRRLPPDQVDDAVQDAIQVILTKGVVPGEGHLVDGVPTLAWCFQVLRNTIGNTYRRARSRAAREASPQEPDALEAASEAPTPLEAMETAEVVRAFRRAIEEVGRADPGCGRYLARVLSGESPAEIAAREGTEPAILYRRIYRCRQKVRELLRANGVEA